jgi:hypothetical protein
MLYSDYHDCEVTPDEAELALEMYLSYCEKESLDSEADDSGFEQFEGNPGLLGHVIYHAQSEMGMANLLHEN